MRSDSPTNTLTKVATACAAICIGVSLPVTAQADTILYHDGTVNGTLWANGTIAIDQAFRTPDNQPSIKFTTSEAYGNGGINFYGSSGPLTVPNHETTLRATIYSENASMNGFVIRMSTGDQNFDSSNGTWRLDGKPGQTKDFTIGQWHILEFDLTSQPNFKRGISQLHNDGLSFKANESGATVYIGDIRLTESAPDAYVDIPEPASYTTLLGISAITLLLGRKTHKSFQQKEQSIRNKREIDHTII